VTTNPAKIKQGRKNKIRYNKQIYATMAYFITENKNTKKTGVVCEIGVQ